MESASEFAASIQKMPQEAANVLVLKYYRGMEVSEISYILGLTIDTVKNIIDKYEELMG